MNDSFFKEGLRRNEVFLENNVSADNSQKHKLDSESKAKKYFGDDKKNLKLLLIVGVLAIVFGVWNMLSKIKNAFVLAPIVLEDKSDTIQHLNQLKDTDSDGLSDYDEKYVYGTSPYLADTDSDGVSDYDELSSDRDPLCAGDKCATNSSDSLSQTKPDKADLPHILSLEEMKQELIKDGYPATEVNKLSQNDLNQIYQEVEKTINNDNNEERTNTKQVIQDLNIGEHTNGNEKYTPPDTELEKLKSLSITEIKDLLIKGGANVKQLESVSDADLRKIYLETLQNL